MLKILLRAGLLFGASTLSALDLASIQPFEMPNARAAAIGGFHAALTDDFSSAFYNPAGFAALAPRISVAEVAAEVNSIDTLYDIYSDNISLFPPSPTVLRLISNRINASVAFGGPICFGGITNGFGWRVFNVTRLNMIWDRNEIFKLNPLFSEEIAASAGYGWRAVDGDSTLDLGIAVKGFYRALYAPEHVFIQDIKHIFSDMDENRYISQLGASFDVGMRWTSDNIFSFAVVYKDFWTPSTLSYFQNLSKFLAAKMYESGSSRILPRLSTGIAVRLPSPVMHRWNTDLIITADYHGLVELFQRSSKSPALFFSAGAELRFLEVVSLRAGWADWLPAGGFGIDFTGFKFDFSLSGKQMGESVGERSTMIATINLQFQY